MQPEPRAPAPLRAATEALFAGLARLRDARPFHPRGAAFTATLDADPRGPLAFLGDSSALVRCSNSAGLPAWSPDVLGLGIRILDGAGPGAPQDLLLASSGEAPGFRHLLVPSRGYDRPRYSSLLFYRLDGRLRLVGARYADPTGGAPLKLADLERAASRGDLRFTLAVAAPRGPWEDAAKLALAAKLPVAQAEQLRFHPWLTSARLRPVGPLNHLRAAAYDGAQRAATSE